MEKPDICIYHSPCLDGFAAAFAVWREWGDDVMFVPTNYGKPLPVESFPKNQRILFVDFCAPEAVMTDLVHSGHQVTVFDHHKTAMDAMGRLLAGGIVKGIFDMNRSGCGIAWDEIHGGRPKLIDFMEDRDLFRFALAGTREIFAVMASLPYDFGVWNTYSREMDFAPEPLIKEGNAILRKNDKDIDEWIENGTQFWRFTDDGQFKVGITYLDAAVPVLNCPYTHGSEAAAKLLALYPSAPFAAYYWDQAGVRRWGLRSEDTRSDVSEIAKARGGGGHRNAAGFEQRG